MTVKSKQDVLSEAFKIAMRGASFESMIAHAEVAKALAAVAEAMDGKVSFIKVDY